jgi:hypothetical protein
LGHSDGAIIAAVVEVKPYTLQEEFETDPKALKRTQEALRACNLLVSTISPAESIYRNALFLGKTNRICFNTGRANSEATKDDCWWDDGDSVAHELKGWDSRWEETGSELAEEGL